MSARNAPSDPSPSPREAKGRFDGGCLCGEVRYSAASAPTLRFNCHCRDCQRTTGSGFAPIAVFSEESVTVTGEPEFFENAGGSGSPIARGFCPRCGSSVFLRARILPGCLLVLAGTLDEPSCFEPRVHIHAAHAPAWAHLDPSLPAFPGPAQRA